MLIELKGAERKGEGISVNYEQNLDFHFLINRTAKNPAIVLLDLINDLNNAILNDYQLKGHIEECLFGLGVIDYSNEITELEKKSFFSATQNIKFITNGYGRGNRTC